ncbi:MAG: hypothetical protein A2V70_18145 [Planctomycetes bacterium RBG_13_63_9]|nr:MAG: hypothetical protein A2V70_18145 [Planctomycetes bacterium RBG_13_63_9]
MTAAEEIKVLEHLSQGALAWLLNVSPRTIRDYHDLPRDGDGRYDGQAAVLATRRRVPLPELSDEETEKLILVADAIEGEVANPRTILAINETLDDLTQRRGDTALVRLVAMILERFRNSAAACREELARPPRADGERAREHAAWASLKIFVRCEQCRRIRNGSSWTKREPPAGYREILGLCPKCEQC